jgi:hypothetical protein
MTRFQTKHLPAERQAVAPDGSDVRILLGLKGGGMAHFELAPGRTSKAVTHRTVERSGFSFQVEDKCGGNNKRVLPMSLMFLQASA